MLEVKVTVTFEKEIKELLGAILGAANVAVADSVSGNDSPADKGSVEKIGGVKMSKRSDMGGSDITIDDIRKIATKLIGSNKKDGLKAVLHGVGVSRIIDIKKEQYAKVHGELLKLQESA